MEKDCKTIYRLCREFAGKTQEQAAEFLPCSLSSLQKYEAPSGTPVPDDIVKAMAQLYRTPMLALWHLKETNPLGEFLPDVAEPKTAGDMGFSVYQAREGANRALAKVHDLLEDGEITPDEHEDAKKLSKTLKAVSGQCLCASTYLDAVCAI